MNEQEEIEACKHESIKCNWNYVPGEFRERFVSPWEQYRDRVGQRFTVMERIEPEDPEMQELYRIRFKGGAIIDAWPEEVCVAEEPDFDDNKEPL